MERITFAGDFAVADNTDGTVMRRFETEEMASGLCRNLNGSPQGMGGRYGVYREVDGQWVRV